MDLVVCLCAGLDRGAARDGEHADRLDGAVVGFGHGGGVAGEGGARRGCGVDGVGFADAAAGLAVGAVHLHHLDAGRGEVARQAGAVAAGAFDADTAHGTPGGQPGGQLAVAGGVRRERRCRQQRPGGINSGGDMDITVRVDPADDLGVLLGHNGAALLGQPTDTGHHRPRRRTGHSRCWTQGSYQVTSVRPVGARPRPATGRQIGREAPRPAFRRVRPTTNRGPTQYECHSGAARNPLPGGRGRTAGENADREASPCA